MKTMIRILAILTITLSGCGVTQRYCLAPCLDNAIDQHVQAGIEENRSESDVHCQAADLRDMELLTDVVRCKVKCQ